MFCKVESCVKLLDALERHAALHWRFRSSVCDGSDDFEWKRFVLSKDIGFFVIGFVIAFEAMRRPSIVSKNSQAHDQTVQCCDETQLRDVELLLKDEGRIVSIEYQSTDFEDG